MAKSKARSTKQVQPRPQPATQIRLIQSTELAHEYWESSLFNEVYLKNDLPAEFSEIWNNDEIGPFHDFYQGFLDLCKDKESEQFDSWSETETINNWIKPIMQLLGWQPDPRKTPFMEEVSFSVEENGARKTYRADLLYVADPEVKKSIQSAADAKTKILNAQTYVTMPLEAKYWDRLEEYKQNIKENKRRNDRKEKGNEKSLTPEDQTLKYMEILKKQFGIVSDGKTWKLLHLELSKQSTQRSFEFDLGDLKEFASNDIGDPSRRTIFLVAAKYFYFFFSKQTLLSEDTKPSPVDQVLAFSQQYVDKMEDDLRKRFIQAMNYSCNGFKRAFVQSRENLDFEVIRSISESLLFNILFIKNCEVRQILPLKDGRYRKISLSSIVEKLDIVKYDPAVEPAIMERTLRVAFQGDFTYTHSGYELYDRLTDLTKLINTGTKGKLDLGFQISGFREGVFSEEECRFAVRNKLTNREMINILFQLGFAESELSHRKFQQIPYNAFTPRQLGSIYESFLEYQLETADDNFVLKVSKKNLLWEKAKINERDFVRLNEPKVGKGELYFTVSGEEKRATGSYYTPDDVVQVMLGELLSEELADKTPEEILNIKICDPSMGSGHFLSGALNFLSAAYLNALDSEGETTLAEAKRQVLNRCIYGVDLNPRAVKLTKLSLWLETAQSGKDLPHLDNQIKHGNSLVPLHMLSASERGKWKKAFDWKQFDLENLIFVGNPPWGATISDDTRIKLSELYRIPKDNINTFVAFMLLPNLLKVKRTNFIIPRNFIRTEGYDKGREELIKNQNLLSIMDFGACFDGVAQEAVAIHYSTESWNKNGIALYPMAKVGDFATQGSMPAKDITSETKFRMNPWFTPDLQSLASKISKDTVPLSSYVEHFRGIEYGKTGEVTKCKSCGNHDALPKKKSKTKKCGHCSAQITSDAKPYFFISKEKTVRHNAPIAVGKAIERYGIKDISFLEKGVKGIDYKDQAFRSEDKILIMKISDAIKGYLDTKKLFTTQAIYMLYLRVLQKNKINLSSVLAILNSRVFKFFYEYTVNMGATLTTNVIFEDILTLPFPKESAFTKTLLNSFETKIQNIQAKGTTPEKLAQIDSEIEKVVCDLYGVNAKEQKAMSAFLEMLASVKNVDEKDDEVEDEAA